MKTITSLVFCICVFTSLSAANVDTTLKKQLDSIRYALLKPRLDNYLNQAARLSAAMNSSNKDSVRYFAKELKKATNDLISSADFIYGREVHSGSNLGMVYVLPSGTITPAIVPYYYKTGDTPPVRDQLLTISNRANNIRWSIGKKDRQLLKIDKVIAELQKY